MTTSGLGKTAYGGTAAEGRGTTIIVNPASRRGDVVAECDGMRIVAECKGGIVKTRHAGSCRGYAKAFVKAPRWVSRLFL